MSCIDVATELLRDLERLHRVRPDGLVEAYPDPLLGWKVPTIGYGTTRYPDGTRVEQGDVVTKEQCEEYLAQELEDECLPALNALPTWPQMNDNQRAAMLSFAYNLGPHFYGKKRFLSITALVDSPGFWDDRDWVVNQFKKYRNPGSSIEAGLKARRIREAELFLEKPS